MKDKIFLTAAGQKAIMALQHKCGTYSYYRDTLKRLFDFVLHNSDEIGMDSLEALDTLRALEALRLDLSCIAGPAIACPEDYKDDEDEPDSDDDIDIESYKSLDEILNLRRENGGEQESGCRQCATDTAPAAPEKREE